jgi:magnesium-protoporphyrin O-methyltransferase
MTSATYFTRRDQLEQYFDRTAVEMWKRMTSDAPLSRVRATVRAGRDAMRAMLLDWLPNDLRGVRILDAGCGTGALAFALANRGATVVGVDVSPTLVALARDRAPHNLGQGGVTFIAGDMLDSSLGGFDYVVAMDSLIHYEGEDIARIVSTLAARTQSAIVFTVAPRTPMLSVVHAVGKLFPRGDRAPSIAPISMPALEGFFGDHAQLAGWRVGRVSRVDRGFYISQAAELTRI